MELLKDDGTFWCKLPDHAQYMSRFSQNGLITCGNPTSGLHNRCYTFVDGIWTHTHTLQRDYNDHCSWESSQGIILLGRRTSDLLTETGSVDSFDFDDYSAE